MVEAFAHAACFTGFEDPAVGGQLFLKLVDQLGADLAEPDAVLRRGPLCRGERRVVAGPTGSSGADVGSYAGVGGLGGIAVGASGGVWAARTGAVAPHPAVEGPLHIGAEVITGFAPAVVWSVLGSWLGDRWIKQCLDPGQGLAASFAVAVIVGTPRDDPHPSRPGLRYLLAIQLQHQPASGLFRLVQRRDVLTAPLLLETLRQGQEHHRCLCQAICQRNSRC